MSARVAARLRIPLPVAGALLILVGPRLGLGFAAWAGVVILLAGLALYFRIGTVEAEPVALRAPVTGRWVALNSPASKVPSHGIQAYGQTYAIDLVRVPTGGYEPRFGWWPATRPASAFPGFGDDVVAPADGTVVRVHDRERDHRSRSSWPGMLLWIVEGFLRELTGPNRILGNHVVIELAPGVYAAVAHLQRRSAKVEPGGRVRAGETIAACGNSGSSTEPHVHLQLMDRPRVQLAAGLPFRFAGAVDDGGDPVELPANGTAIVA